MDSSIWMRMMPADLHHRRTLPSLLLGLALLIQPPLSCAQISGNNNPGDQPVPYQFNPSMLIIIFVLIAAFFLMGFFSIYIRHRSVESEAATVGATARGRSRRMRGLDPAVIEAFPVVEYSAVKAHRLGKGALECAVCLNEFEDDEALRLLPNCKHAFHPDCIDAWLASHTTCPVCRCDLASGAPADLESALASAGEAEPGRDHVAVVVDPAPNGEEPPVELAVPSQTPPFQMQNRPIRSKSSLRPSRFPRSHTTGHSLVVVQPGEDVDRFTLRLPDNVLKEIMSRRLNRTASLLEGGLVSAGSSRGGRWFRGGVAAGDGSSRGRALFPLVRSERAAKSDRWIFSKTPPFFTRTASIKSIAKRADGETTGSFKGHFSAVTFDCLSPKADSSCPAPAPAARSSSPIFTVSGQ